MTLNFILFFGFLHSLMFLFYSLKKKNFINPLFIIFGLTFFTYFFFPVIYIIKYDTGHSFSYGLLATYILIFITHLTYLLVMLFYKVPRIKFLKIHHIKKNLFISLILGIIFIVLVYYFIEIIHFQSINNLSPRDFYAQTRQSAGLGFIVSTIMVFFLIVVLLNFKSNFLKLIVLILLFYSSLYVGSKSIIFTFTGIVLFYLSYKNNLRINFVHIVIIGLIFIIFSFYNQNFTSKLLAFSLYSDYVWNSEYIINNINSYTYGSLFVEDNFYSRIPRFLYDSKPIFFGSSELSMMVNEKQVLSMQGSPSLGYGKIYAEFGIFSFPLIFLVTLFNAFFLKLFSNSVKENLSIAHFILFLYFAKLPIIQVPPAWVLPEIIILSSIAYYIYKLRIGTYKK